MFGEFYYNSCLSLLLQLACSIHTTWCIDLSRSLYSYLLAEFGIDITGCGKLEPRVGVGAGGAFRAEAGEVVDAEDAADVPVDRESSLVSHSLRTVVWLPM